MLSCSCPEYVDGSWEYIEPDDFTILQANKRKRCCSCKELINIGATCIEFKRHRYPKNDIEDRIYGYDSEIEIASLFLCEKCGDQYFNLSALGFCVDITENMFELLKEYVEEYLPWKQGNKV